MDINQIWKQMGADRERFSYTVMLHLNNLLSSVMWAIVWRLVFSFWVQIFRLRFNRFKFLTYLKGTPRTLLLFFFISMHRRTHGTVLEKGRAFIIAEMCVKMTNVFLTDKGEKPKPWIIILVVLLLQYCCGEVAQESQNWRWPWRSYCSVPAQCRDLASTSFLTDSHLDST